jgi:thioredoxin reductase (NADPH)
MTGNPPSGPRLDDQQFQRLAAAGAEEHAEAGRELYSTGDDSYDLFLLVSATVDIVREATTLEPERRVYQGRPGDFLGELSLLTGQHVYLTARVVDAGTVVRINAATLRQVLAEEVDIADALIAAFRARRDTIRAAAGNALEIVGHPGDAPARELRTYVTQLLLPHAWFDATSVSGRALMRQAELREVDLPAATVTGRILRNATPGALAETLGLTYRTGGQPTWLSSAEVRPVWPPLSTRHPKGSRQSCWIPRGSVGRRPRALGSRTISASRRVSAEKT